MKRFLCLAIRVCALAACLAGLWPTPAAAATIITVTTTDDGSTGCIEDHPCSLRAALERANAVDYPVTIEFNIPGPAPHTIVLEAPLPSLGRNDLEIHGESDPDFVDRPVIVIDGSQVAATSGLEVGARRVTIRGLSLVGFTGSFPAIDIRGDYNVVRNCMVGLTPGGDPSGGEIGIRVSGNHNTIRSNVISGNQTGVKVQGPYNSIYSNYIGVDLSGSRAIPGMMMGIDLETAADNTQIGGTGRGEGNVISGAAPWGWGIMVGSIFENVIAGNKIGTNAAGDTAIPNFVGIDIASSTCMDGCPIPFNTRIESNLISGNLSCGIDLGRTTTLVYGNYVGTDASGTRPLPNGECGVRLSSDDVRLGGTSPGQGNVISGNPIGVDVEGEGNQLTGNRIGTNADGTAAVPNRIGVRVTGGNSLIGGDEPGHGNLISGNDVGLLLAADDAIVRNNRIGTDASEIRALPNGVGIRLEGFGEGDYIGGGDEGMRNLVAFNRSHGIELVMAGGVDVTGNLIHHNGGDGIRLSSGDVGASGSAARNTFSLNSTYQNGGLGIAFQDRAFNRGIAPPEITRGERTRVSGTACPNCRVEVFLADVDPSGFGEGKTFLAWNQASPDGQFGTSYPDIGACKVLTATATDAQGNTSTFSRNFGVGICLRPRPLVALIWVIGAAGGGSAFTVIIRRRPLTLRVAPWLLLGGLLGLGAGILLLRLPFVQIAWPQQSGQSAPGGLPAGLPAPVTPNGTYAADTLQPPTLTVTPYMSVTPSAPAPPTTGTPTLQPPELTLLQDANCRRGPGVVYDVVTYALRGQTLAIDGRNDQDNWWRVRIPDTQILCWIAANLGQPSGDLETVPVRPAPPTPKPTLTAKPVQGCWVIPQGKQLPVCTVPCPPNAKPGGVCTP